jgi:hypothetical protein
MGGRKKVKCVRCESLERPQKSKVVYSIANAAGDKIPLCAVCVIEIKEEEDFFKEFREGEEDEPGGEVLNL